MKFNVGDNVKALKLPVDIDSQEAIDFFSPVIGTTGVVVLASHGEDGKPFYVVDFGGRKGKVGTVAFDGDEIEASDVKMSIDDLGTTVGHVATIVSLPQTILDEVGDGAEMVIGAPVAIIRAGMSDYDYYGALPMGLGIIGLNEENIKVTGKLGEEVMTDNGPAFQYVEGTGSDSALN